MKDKKSGGKSLWCILFGVIAACGGLQLVRLLWMRILPFFVKTQTVAARSTAVSIGIIGGADGPTSIFVATPDWTAWILPCAALIAGILGICLLRRRKEK